MKKVICFVLSTKKYEDRIRRIENTWSKDIDTIFYSDHEDLNRNIIKIHDQSDYRSAEIKQCNVLNFIKTTKYIHSYDWICFSDDDTFFNVKLLKQNIQDFDENKSYGNVINYENDSRNPIFNRVDIPKDLNYPSGGSGFFISRKVLFEIPEFKSFNSGFGDVTYGLNLYHNNKKMMHNKLLHSQPPEFYSHNDDDIINNLSYHYILDDVSMERLYQITR